ncbi:extracellular catalytic domain type 1 short-chain-length polyhydroxyalkanoate depolymerase [Catellatospora tritici]|uniref:extracellular catalytic domain type 1 short-chain-length polyhydroxyalkanoate depolymerase n=1 Tax=Catellatospora tritici TaxID=2851566 RepID=UPI001C2D5500|nr:PHB depolymerase family esterase [Catellatospora tritici]MBV1853134.1 PHB depolymerase family esterase [Catellatospora tritici]
MTRPRWFTTLLTGVAALAAATAATAVAIAPAQAAATLTQVTGFGSNPGALSMYAYRPTGLPTGAPLVVALHGCTQTANDYFANSGWQKYADLYGFALVLPQQSSANNANSCFNFFQPSDATRGQGEALSVKQMVDYAKTNYGSDAARIYVTGLSAGGAMTSVMLATYPDVFAGGAVVAGLAYRCATDTSSAYTCMYGAVSKTPTQWGDLVRNAYAGYPGPWPKVSIWAGSSDTTVVPANADELRDQWVNVHGISTTATGTSSLPASTTRTVYGTGQVITYRVQGIGHGTPVDPGSGVDQCGAAAAYFLDSICSSYRIAQDWGLATGGPAPSPSASASPAPSPSASPSASPSPSPTNQPCFTASNYAQTTAGRAHQSGGYTYANGSNQAMGLWNVAVIHTLRQTGPNYYVLADGQC